MSQLATQKMPQRRIFMMGNGKPVQPSVSKQFCDTLIDGLLDGKIISNYEFTMGFAACFDAISRGTIDLQENPIDTMEQAWADIANVTMAPNKITDVMRIECDR